jgi:hypothetical protein
MSTWKDNRNDQYKYLTVPCCFVCHSKGEAIFNPNPDCPSERDTFNRSSFTRPRSIAFLLHFSTFSTFEFEFPSKPDFSIDRLLQHHGFVGLPPRTPSQSTGAAPPCPGPQTSPFHSECPGQH